jgi:hypothetical protein
VTWLERVRGLAARWWALPALLVVVALVLAWRLDAGRRAEADRARLAEEAQLRAEGLLVVEQVRSRALDLEARRLAGQNADLSAELERARRAAPGARVTGTVSASTGPRPAGGAPRPGQVVYRCETEPGAAPPAGPPPPACILADGDVGEIRVDQVELETREGARVLVGAASVWRLDPAPQAKVMAGGFQAPLSVAKEPARPAPPGWGAGLYAGVSRDGWALGPALALPPARLLGMQGEVVLGVGVGPSGAWQGSGVALVRW